MSLRCMHAGCDAFYDEGEASNPATACCYHPQGPLFRDGKKAWSCCGKGAYDFDDFVKIPGCARGPHGQDKPGQAVKAVPASAPVQVDLGGLSEEQRQCVRCRQGIDCVEHATMADQPEERRVTRDACPRCRNGFLCSDHPSAPLPAELTKPEPRTWHPTPKAKKEDPAAPEEGPLDPDAERTCCHKGCGNKYRERDNADDACKYHPGPPLFHEGRKGWQCCDRHVLDFDEFMTIPPCTTGRHSDRQ